MTNAELIKTIELLLNDVDNGCGCPMCDFGNLRPSAIKRGEDHWSDCVWNNARKIVEDFKQQQPFIEEKK